MKRIKSSSYLLSLKVNAGLKDTETEMRLYRDIQIEVLKNTMLTQCRS